MPAVRNIRIIIRTSGPFRLQRSSCSSDWFRLIGNVAAAIVRIVGAVTTRKQILQIAPADPQLAIAIISIKQPVSNRAIDQIGARRAEIVGVDVETCRRAANRQWQSQSIEIIVLHVFIKPKQTSPRKGGNLSVDGKGIRLVVREVLHRLTL